MRKFWKIFLMSLGTYLGLEGDLSFKRFKVKGCQCAFLMHMGTRITTEPVVSFGTEILFTFFQVSVEMMPFVKLSPLSSIKAKKPIFCSK